MARMTVQKILQKKQAREKITALTAYDFPTAKIVDEAGIDIILVGDSLGVVVQGLENTLPVTMEEMRYHTRMVSRAVQSAMVIGDMPFLSYQTSLNDAIHNAGLFLKEGAHGVKIEGGTNVVELIRTLTSYDIPVMAHIGLTPQSIHRLGGFRVQGRDDDAAQALLDDARRVEDAGAFTLVLEGIPSELGARITEAISIPTIGIGAGPACDGQILVIHDLLGLFDRFVPKFVKQYADLRNTSLDAIRQYAADVTKGVFPSKEQSYE